jgi:hypothetical protein
MAGCGPPSRLKMKSLALGIDDRLACQLSRGVE